MPNHVTNILTFGGKREDIDELMLDILNEKDEVTFKKVCPQPYEIKNTSSPVRVVSNAEYLILKNSALDFKFSEFLGQLQEELLELGITGHGQ